MDELKQAIKDLGYDIGCVTSKSLSKKDIKRIIAELPQEQTDVKVTGGYVEIVTIDTEKDIIFISNNEYKNRYGEE